MELEQLIVQAQAVHRIYLTNKGLEVDDGWFAMKLAEELGELTQAYLRLRHRHLASPEARLEAKSALADECADLLCHLLLFSARNEVDLVQAIRRKWLSYLERA